MKAKDLQGAALDWAVATAQGYSKDNYMHNIDMRLDVNGKVSCLLVPIHRNYVVWSPSTNWSQGGPIIERVGIDIRQIWRGTHHLYAYDERDRKRWPNAEVVARETIHGPSRYLKVPIVPQPNDGKWMAKLARSSSSSVEWSIKTDFPSDTPLIAAMRCYVAYKLGSDIEIPKELES